MIEARRRRGRPRDRDVRHPTPRPDRSCASPPPSSLIVAVWVVGLLLRRASRQATALAEERARARSVASRITGHRRRKPERHGTSTWSTAKVGGCCSGSRPLATLGRRCGARDERREPLRARSACRASSSARPCSPSPPRCPRSRTGLTAVKQATTNSRSSDIFGGNAFLPVLFLVATLISGKAVLPSAHAQRHLPHRPRGAAHPRLHRRPRVPTQTTDPRHGPGLPRSARAVRHRRRRAFRDRRLVTRSDVRTGTTIGHIHSRRRESSTSEVHRSRRPGRTPPGRDWPSGPTRAPRPSTVILWRCGCMARQSVRGTTGSGESTQRFGAGRARASTGAGP